MMIDVQRSQFVNADVLHSVPGLTPATIQTWANRGLFGPSADRNPGTGQRRLYTALEICGFALMHELTNLGFPPKEASEMVQRIIANEKDQLDRGNPVGRTTDHAIISKNPDDLRLRVDSGETVPAPRFQVTYLVKEGIPKSLPRTCIYLAFGEVILDTLNKLEVLVRD